MQLNTSENTDSSLKVFPNSDNVQYRMSSTGRKILIFSVLVSLTIGFGSGFWFSNYKVGESLPVIRELVNKDLGKPEELDFSLFWQVWTKLNEKYVDPKKLDSQALLYGAIEGMVNSVGDPYTVFLEPVISTKFQEEISGAFGGIGIEIGKRDGILTVISPLKDTPAYEAGLKAGNRIIKIDGQTTESLSIEEAVNLIRGKKGTAVVLTVAANDGSNIKDVELIRAAIKIPTVKWELLEGNVAYMQIYSFNKNVDPDFEKASQEILQSPATRLIIDLRNNPGGLLDSAINLAGWFLDSNQIVTMEEFRDGTRQSFRSEGNGALKIYPTMFLINGGSASASEILAGAVRDNRGIKLVGEKSFGKGSVQELEEFDGGSSLKVTIAKWLTPSGHSITDLGIEPDFEVKLPEKPEEGTLEFGKPGKDPQLDKALELLR
jgi:carboxyl-terminal processing protease